MDTLEILLDKRWILKAENKELYYKIRDSIGEVRKFLSEKLGCQVIENSLLVKLEKIPAIPECYMGIMDFTSKEEYAFLCVFLMFLEDKDASEQFVLSQLTEYIQANMPEDTVDWTVYTNRRRLVKVLTYCVQQGIVHVTDGEEDAFTEDQNAEVLYENTGASRYFMRSFSRNISEYCAPADFEESEWYGVEEDRGTVRRQRVYKRLLFSAGMYRDTGSIEDFEYLKYYGRRLAEELETMFSCNLHIHRGSAYLILGEECRMGLTFPQNNMLSDILLLCCAAIRDRIVGEDAKWQKKKDEIVAVDELELHQLIKEVKREHEAGFTKKYKEMPEGEFVKTILGEMERLSFIKRNDREQQIIIYPAVGKLSGRYPDNL